jgi:DNA-binding MarR family transcriptional regulator
MAAPFEELAELDRLIHEPARLSLLTALSVCRSADFLYLQRLTGLSKGNLSSHLAKLEAANLVGIEKEFVGKVPNTRVSLTRGGRSAIERHWKRLDELRRDASSWTADEPSVSPSRS